MRLEIDARAQRFLASVPQKRIFAVLELVVLALLAVQVARLVWTLITPVGPVGQWRVTAARDPGSAAEIVRSFDPFFRLEAPASSAAAAVITPLQLTLFGIRLDEASGRGSAIIATPDGMQNSVAVGDEVMPGVTLKSVSFDHVTLSRGGADEDLFIDQSGAVQSATPGATNPLLGATPVAAPAGQPVTVTRLRSEVGFIPRIDNGKVTGLFVRPQGSGNVFRQIGLKEGDVVTQLGGRSINGTADVDVLMGQFAQGGALSATVERGAEVLPLTITLAGQ